MIHSCENQNEYAAPHKIQFRIKTNKITEFNLSYTRFFSVRTKDIARKKDVVGWKIEREIERTAVVHKEKKPVDKPINPFSLFIWKWIGETLCGRSQVSLNPRWKHKNGKKSAALLLKIFQQYFILMKPHHPLTMLLAYIAIEWNFLLANNYSGNIVRHFSTANVWFFFHFG